MLIGFVSDERYVALADVLLEFQQDGKTSAIVRSTPRGAVEADLSPGEYVVTLVKQGYGSKHSRIIVDPQRPWQFRLLSDGLLGYVWPRWVKSGERSEFFVHATEPYRLSLWRYGWKREFVKLLGWFDEHGPRAVMQITPDGDYTQTGVDWNRVGYVDNPHHTNFVIGPERSGLYYVHAKGEHTGTFFSFPWVVAPARATAPIAVLASTNTWLAYNNFGGRSNYINAHQLPDRPTINARQDLIRYTQAGSFNVWGFADNEYLPLSFERPELGNIVGEVEEVTDPIAGRMTCGMAPAEWRLLGWLEREGFAYDYYAESQLHSGVLDLDQYRVLILSVHPEYWSREMYLRVKDWVWNRGGKLIYLGGNGLNCEVEFIDDSRLRFKTYLAGPGGALGMFDPGNPEVYLDSRMARTLESEANLLGVVCTDTGIMTAAPYRVVCPDHWCFAGTGLRAGDIFGEKNQQERVSGGASGHETDKISPHSPPGTVVLAKGMNCDEGGAEMVHYETATGGAVSSVGSITYVPCLLVDDAISRITSNVLTRFLAESASCAPSSPQSESV
ncbi:MAG: carboxypeptidase regulatory-like domain-containing protein [Planctomycetota bacterium]|nr:carboxypeptidase regulatory-like domain-containing protein [Planctomycetota bacterium]MDA1178539.1 carboxypeptidase regulatory-like domain-containing protein [Planctomycetota bacterium]